jgi:hypothetical protein
MHTKKNSYTVQHLKIKSFFLIAFASLIYRLDEFER